MCSEHFITNKLYGFICNSYLACALILLSACGPTPSNLPRSVAASMPTATSQATHSAEWAQTIEQLERTGRTAPTQSIQTALALVPHMPTGSDIRLEALTVAGLLAGQQQSREPLAQVLQELQAWDPKQAPERVKLALTLIQARAAWDAGDTKLLGNLVENFQADAVAREPVHSRIRLRHFHGAALIDTEHLDQAIGLLQQALGDAQKIDSSWRSAISAATLSLAYVTAHQPDRALAMLEFAQQRAQRDPDPITLMHVATQACFVYGELQQRKLEHDHCQAAVDYARQAGSLTDEASALGNLSDHYLRSHDYSTALRLARTALPLARQTHNFSAEIVALHNIGQALIAQKSMAEGKAYILQSLELDEKHGQSGSVAESWRDLVHRSKQPVIGAAPSKPIV